MAQHIRYMTTKQYTRPTVNRMLPSTPYHPSRHWGEGEGQVLIAEGQLGSGPIYNTFQAALVNDIYHQVMAATPKPGTSRMKHKNYTQAVMAILDEVANYATTASHYLHGDQASYFAAQYFPGRAYFTDDWLIFATYAATQERADEIANELFNFLMGNIFTVTRRVYESCPHCQNEKQIMQETSRVYYMPEKAVLNHAVKDMGW